MNCQLAPSMIPDPVVTPECSLISFTKTINGASIDSPLGLGSYSVTATSSTGDSCSYEIQVVDSAPIDMTACACGSGNNILKADNEGETFQFQCNAKPNGCPQTVDSVYGANCILCSDDEDSPSSKSSKSGKGSQKCGANQCDVTFDNGDDTFRLNELGPAGTFVSVVARISDARGNTGLAECVFCVSESVGTKKSMKGRGRRSRELRRRMKKKSNSSNESSTKGSKDEDLETFECPVGASFPFQCPLGFKQV